MWILYRNSSVERCWLGLVFYVNGMCDTDAAQSAASVHFFCKICIKSIDKSGQIIYIHLNVLSMACINYNWKRGMINVQRAHSLVESDHDI